MIVTLRAGGKLRQRVDTGSGRPAVQGDQGSARPDRPNPRREAAQVQGDGRPADHRLPRRHGRPRSAQASRQSPPLCSTSTRSLPKWPPMTDPHQSPRRTLGGDVASNGSPKRPRRTVGRHSSRSGGLLPDRRRQGCRERLHRCRAVHRRDRRRCRSVGPLARRRRRGQRCYATAYQEYPPGVPTAPPASRAQALLLPAHGAHATMAPMSPTPLPGCTAWHPVQADRDPGVPLRARSRHVARRSRVWDSDLTSALKYVSTCTDLPNRIGQHEPRRRRLHSRCDGTFAATTNAGKVGAWINALAGVGVGVVVASGDDDYVNAVSKPTCFANAVSVGNTTLTEHRSRRRVRVRGQRRSNSTRRSISWRPAPTSAQPCRTTGSIARRSAPRWRHRTWPGRSLSCASTGTASVAHGDDAAAFRHAGDRQSQRDRPEPDQRMVRPWHDLLGVVRMD